MNIFVTNIDPLLAAQDLDDQRLIKMCLETAQLLGTALHIRGIWKFNLYRPYAEHHECCQWAAASRNNFRWLYKYGKALTDEYKFRFGRIHGSHIIMDNAWEIFQKRPEVFPEERMTPFANCTPYKQSGWDITECYQKYLMEHKWGPLTRWSKRGKPVWYKTLLDQIIAEENLEVSRKVAGG